MNELSYLERVRARVTTQRPLHWSEAAWLLARLRAVEAEACALRAEVANLKQVADSQGDKT